MNNIGKNTLWLTGTKFMNLGFTFLTTIILSNYRSLIEFGTYSQLVSISTLASSIIILGLPTSINYFLSLSKIKDERKKILSNFYTLSLILSTFIGILLFLLSNFVSDYFNNNLIRLYSFFLLIYPCSLIIGSSIDNVMIYYGKMKTLLFYRVVNSLVIFLISIFASIYTINFLTYIFILSIIMILFISFELLLVFLNSDKFRFEFDFFIIKKLMSYSIPIGIGSIFGIIAISIDKLMIGRMYSAEDFAIYTNAARQLPLNVVVVSLNAILIPHIVKRLSKGDIRTSIDLWKNATLISFAFLSFFAMILFVFAPDVISILFSDKYLPGVTIFRINSVSILVQTANYSLILNALGKTKYYLYFSFLTMILNIVFNIIFNIYLGLNGFILATLLTTTVTALIQLKVTSSVIRVSIRQMFPWIGLFWILFLVIFLGLVLFILKLINLTGNSFLNFAILLAISSSLYFLIIIKPVSKWWKNLNIL